MPGPGRSSGSEPLDAPVSAGAATVEDAVMEAVVPALPELDRIRFEAVTSPVRRARHGAGILSRESGEAALECGAGCHLDAFRRCPCRELAAPRARGEVFVPFSRRHFRHAPVHPHLLLEIAPVEDQARARVARELAALAAAVVGV